ncbi:MAG: amidohydrolase, partial [Mesorhizobium sp.]
MTKDILISADTVITMDSEDRVIADGAVLVRGNRIAAIGDRGSLETANPGAELRRLKNRLLMPGLVNAHCHSGILRGTAEGLPVWDWLRMFIDPMHRVLNPREAEVASWLCYAEAVLSGTTTIVDMWRYMDG